MFTIAARLERVTLYAAGARVRRVTEVSSSAPRVRIVGLPVSVIDDSLRVEIDGPAIAVGARVGLAVDERAPGAEQEQPAELRAAELAIARAAGELARIDGALADLARTSAIAADERDLPPAAWADVVAARRAVIAVRAARELALRTQRAAAQRAVEQAERAHAAAVDRDRRLGSARAPRAHELRKYAELELQPDGDGDGELLIHIEYLVAAARWAPSYVARIDGERVALELRAVVAQETGEDWTDVPLELSTAEPTRFAPLPELPAQRIGRRQAEPARAGFRPPPSGAEALYADHDRTAPPPPAPPPAPAFEPSPALDEAFSAEVWDEESSHSKQAFAPQAEVARKRGGGVLSRVVGAAAAGGAPMRSRAAPGMAPPAPPLPAPAPPAPRLDYGALRMAAASSPARGRLVPAPVAGVDGAIARELAEREARLRALPLPPGCSAAWTHSYDHAYATDAAVDVRADGSWHAIAVTAAQTTARIRHVAVPRVQQDVFRIAAIPNALPGPLLPGPIDVYDRGRFVVTSAVDYAPPGARVEIGLGVDPAVKIARNSEFREEAAGVLRGALRLLHAVAIDVDNLAGRAIELEVRERLPVVADGDDDVEVTLGRVEPAWERWTPDAEAPRAARLRGGYRWRIALAAGARQTLRASYEVRIAGKLELVGGNRRDA